MKAIKRPLCLYCGINRVKRNKAKYCSNECKNNAQIKNKPKYCEICSTKLKNGNIKFCSNYCKDADKRINRFPKKVKPKKYCVICKRNIKTKSVEYCTECRKLKLNKALKTFPTTLVNYYRREGYQYCGIHKLFYKEKCKGCNKLTFKEEINLLKRREPISHCGNCGTELYVKGKRLCINCRSKYFKGEIKLKW